MIILTEELTDFNIWYVDTEPPVIKMSREY